MDIFQVVKALRVQKPGAILNVVSVQQGWCTQREERGGGQKGSGGEGGWRMGVI